MQGPPGTGKSQTIANIISECIAQGKSVLFVSDKMAALEVVYKRLAEVGLAHFCLELHSQKANKQEVVAELKRCIDEQLVVKKLPSVHEFEKMVSLRDRLNSYVTSLHQLRHPLERTVYEVLGELSTLDTVPFISVGLVNPRSLTQQELQEIEELVSRLKGTWKVVEEKDFPWRGYIGNEYKAEVLSELSRYLDDFVSSIDGLLAESKEYSASLGLENQSKLDQMKWLVEVGDFIRDSPSPESKWVLSSSIDELVSEAKGLQEKCNVFRETRDDLLQRYEASIFKLSLGRFHEIENALFELSKLFGTVDLVASDFLSKQSKMLEIVKDTGKLTKDWVDQATELIAAFGLSADNLNIEKIRRLVRIATLCYSSEKPEANWLNNARLEKLKKMFPKLKADYGEYNSLRKRLGENYNDSLYDLDLNALIERYSGQYKSFTRFLSSSFRRDQEDIAKTTRRGRVPATVLDDLNKACRLKTLKTEIDAQAGEVHNLLGQFYQGYETDFERVEAAVQVASEVTGLSENIPLPEQLVQLVSKGPASHPTLKHDAESLGAAVDRWYSDIQEVASFVPVDRMPNSSMPIAQTDLALLREWAEVSEKQLLSLSELCKEGLMACKVKPQNYEQLLMDLRLSEEVRREKASFMEQWWLLRERFGSRFLGLDTDWREVVSVLEWTKKLQDLFGSRTITQMFAEVVAHHGAAPSNQKLVENIGAVFQRLAGFDGRFDAIPTYKGYRLEELNIYTIRERISTLRQRIDELQVWTDFKNVKKCFFEKGLDGFWNRLTNNPLSRDELPSVLKKGVYEEWIRSIYDEDKSLGEFRRENHEQLIAEFQNLDRELIQLAPWRIIKVADGRRPHEVWVQASNSEITVLLREAAKKRRRMPIRQLFQTMTNLLSILKPCLLMSPLSVSQFLSPMLERFDLVLFDEASQIVPEDAIGAIYRGKAVVVAGDNRQLPPTSFFQKSLIDDYDWDEVGEEVEIFDSILEECLGIGLPVKTLRWHYRSRNEGLITFSNQRFYDGSLITFPSAFSSRDGLGVRLVHVPNGVYDRGGRRDNELEAEVVADLAVEHFRERSEKTLGVVTFSIAQMEAVEDALERRLREHPELERFFEEDRLQGFFVKNLENVQGDERDVMIISIGYGRDSKGQITMNFGPLNKSGGERRLNVAITRARENVIIVSSIKAGDIDLESTNAAGVLALHDYLDYAEKGPDPLKSICSQTGFDSALEEEVADEVRRMGYDVLSHVGCSGLGINIGVVDPDDHERFLLGVEFDGQTYRSANSARDRDRLRGQVLERLGWRIYRIWSPSWTARRVSEVKRLREAIEEARRIRQNGGTVQEDEFEPSTVSIEVRQAGYNHVGGIGIPYKVSELKANFTPFISVKRGRPSYYVKQKNEFYMPSNLPEQCRLLAKLVKEEGPIHSEYAAQRLAKAWGCKRILPRIAAAVKEAVSECEVKGQLVVKGDFLWPPQLKDVPVRIPIEGMPESMRIIKYISGEEIENAMRLIVYHSVGIASESLLDETARLFGFQRTGTGVRERLFKIYNGMLEKRQLIYDNRVVTLPRDG
ncbi:DUF3320 domain-containing protein [Candidatus Bathyarchaeota archaeon]|nr:DUF3320 domain-containing protein [Candidatus Bathyarchaeota archaeon]